MLLRKHRSYGGREYSRGIREKSNQVFRTRTFIELTKALSPTTRYAKSKCGSACADNGAIEIAIGLLGVSKVDEANLALITLLGAKLDGAGSEELGCIILTRGKEITPYFSRLSSKESAAHCHETFYNLKKLELSDVKDVDANQICRTEKETEALRDSYFHAITSGRSCDR